MILEKLQNGFAWRLLHALVGLQILTSEGALEYWLAPSGGAVICGKLEQQRKGDRLGMSRNAWMNGREFHWAPIGSKRICMYLAYIIFRYIIFRVIMYGGWISVLSIGDFVIGAIGLFPDASRHFYSFLSTMQLAGNSCSRGQTATSPVVFYAFRTVVTLVARLLLFFKSDPQISKESPGHAAGLSLILTSHGEGPNRMTKLSRGRKGCKEIK